jgi:hypothetical protein
MSIFRGFYMILLFLCLATSCGKKSSSKLSSNDDVLNKPLLIVMSGFGSCVKTRFHGEWESPVEMPMTVEAIKISREIYDEFGVESDIFVSCYTKLSELRYATSDDNFMKLNTNQNPEDVARLVRKRSESTPNTFIIGHSYGGWTSMKTFLASSSKSSLPTVKAYYSLDPISRKLCRLENPLSWGQCTGAPKDLTDNELISIRAQTDIWVNVWQDRTSFLHSAPIDHAHINTYYPVQHWDVNGLDEVWSGFHQEIRRVYSEI